MRCVAVVALLLALSGCGGDGDRGIAGEAAGPLADRVAAVRVAAAEGRAQALTELTALRELVDRLLEQGDLSESAAERIRAAADGVEAGLPSPPATTDTPPDTTPSTDPPTTTTAPPTTTTAPPAPPLRARPPRRRRPPRARRLRTRAERTSETGRSRRTRGSRRTRTSRRTRGSRRTRTSRRTTEATARGATRADVRRPRDGGGTAS